VERMQVEVVLAQPLLKEKVKVKAKAKKK